MTETINILKFNIPLDENKLQKLNNIQGKYLYTFHILMTLFFEANNLQKDFQKLFISS